MRSKIIAVLSAIAIALGMVAFTSTAASAHHNTITASVSCNVPTGQWTVVWSVKNSEGDKTEEITASNHTDIVPVGTTFAQGETKTFTQTLSAPTDVTLTLGAKWSNGYENTNSGSISKSAFKGGCTPPPSPVSGNATAVNEVCTNGVVTKGYIQVAITTGVVYTVTKNGSSTPIAFDGTTGKTGPLDAGDYTVTAKAADGYTLNNPKSWSLTITSAGTCTPPPCLPKSAVSYTYDATTNSGIITVTAAAGYSDTLCKPFWVTAASWTFDGSTHWPQTLDKWNPANGGNKIATVGTYPYGAEVGCGQGDIYATFNSPGVPKPNPEILNGPSDPYKEFFLHGMGFTGPTPTYMHRDAATCNPKVVQTVPAVTFKDVCGTDDDGIIGGADTAEINYTITDNRVNGVGTVTATAVPKTGYSFAAGAYTGPWTHTFTDEPCPIEVTTVPAATFKDKCGTGDDQIVGAADTAEIDYTITDNRVAGVGLVTVTAAPQPGHVFKTGAYTGPWSHEFTSADCTVIFGDPYAVDEKCPQVEDGDKVTGYIWVDLESGLDSKLSYQITGGPTSVDYTATQEINNLEPGDYTVTVTAKPGYKLDDTMTSVWHFTIKGAGLCDLITHPLIRTSATYQNLTCKTAGSYTLADTEGVLWFVNGSATPTAPGTYQVKGATTIDVVAGLTGPDFGWEDDAQTEWTFTFTNPVDCLPTLAFTGSDGGNLGLLLAGGFLLFGGTIVAFERRSRATVR